MSKVEPHFKAILALVAMGISIEAALRSRAEFPIKATWKSYAYDDRFPGRRRQVEAAQTKGKTARARKGFTAGLQRYTEEDYTRSLLIISASNADIRMIDLLFDGVPGYTMLHRRAQADPVFAQRFAAAKGGRRWGGRDVTYSADDMRAAIDGIQTEGLGAYKNAIGVRQPSHSQIWKRAKRDAALAKDYRTAIYSRTNRMRAARSSDDLYGRVDRIVPPRIDPDMRQDVVSDIVEAVLSGRLAEDQIAKRCAEFVTAHNRSFSRFKAISLDAPMFDDSARSMLDDLTTDPAHQWGI